MTSDTSGVLRLRGALVGSASGVVSVGAHLFGGGMVPGDSTLVLTVAACSAVGAAVSGIRREQISATLLLALLAAGQLIGHIALTVSSDHMHQPLLSTQMLAFHTLGILVALTLVRGVERAYHVVVQKVLRVLPMLLRLPVAPLPATVSDTPVYRCVFSRWLLVSAGTGTRGPPALV